MLLTVSARTARESMSLDDALKALAFGDTRNLKKVARSKNRNINRVPFFHFTLVARLQSEFFQCFIKSAFHGSGASFTNFSFFFVTALSQALSHYFYIIFTSISTPEGNDKLVRASMVFAFGLIISISLLWTRISNCSRVFL